MRKAIFFATGFAAIAAFFCIGCSDHGDNDDPDTPGGNRDGGYTLNVIAGNGGTFARYPNEDTYKYGEEVIVVATAETGYTFAGWSGASTSTNATITIIMDGDKTLTANFQRIMYTLITTVSPPDGGDVSQIPNKAAYNEGEEVTVTAIAADGYTFTEWSGASTSATPTITITMDSSTALTANFELTTYKITTSVSPAGGGTISIDPNKAAYNPGETVIVTVSSSASYTFLGWSGSSTSTNASVSIIMDGNKTLVANFQRKTANAVIITLTSLNTTVTDVGGIDPRVHFVVTAYRNGSQISSNTTGYLLDATDINQPWSGSKQSSAVPFANQADELRISAVVVEKDLLFDDDISPSQYIYWLAIPAAGESGSEILDYGRGKSRVGFSYRFVLQ